MITQRTFPCRLHKSRGLIFITINSVSVKALYHGMLHAELCRELNNTLIFAALDV
jgi:hypothetical protein